MKYAVAILVGLALQLGGLFVGCGHNPPPTPPWPADVDAAAPSDACQGNAPSCACLCEHRTHLGCKSAETTPGGSTCLDVCANATDIAGPWVWDLSCRVSSSTCAELGCR